MSIEATVTCDECGDDEPLVEAYGTLDFELPDGWSVDSHDDSRHFCPECNGESQKPEPHVNINVPTWQPIGHNRMDLYGQPLYMLQCLCGAMYYDRTIVPQFNCLRCGTPVIGEVNTLVPVRKEAQ